MLSVLWPVSFIATLRGTPARSRFRTAVRRNSWMSPSPRTDGERSFSIVSCPDLPLPPRDVLTTHSVRRVDPLHRWRLAALVLGLGLAPSCHPAIREPHRLPTGVTLDPA